MATKRYRELCLLSSTGGFRFLQPRNGISIPSSNPSWLEAHKLFSCPRGRRKSSQCKSCLTPQLPLICIWNGAMLCYLFSSSIGYQENSHCAFSCWNFNVINPGKSCHPMPYRMSTGSACKLCALLQSIILIFSPGDCQPIDLAITRWQQRV